MNQQHQNKEFNLSHCLHDLKHYLPTQTPLKDFIHHNTLHAFQHLKFYDAIFKAAEIFGYKVTLQLQDYRALMHINRIDELFIDKAIAHKKGKEQVTIWKERLLYGIYDEHQIAQIDELRSLWREEYHIDIDNLIQPLLFRILSSYLDQGISLKHIPVSNKLSFIEAMRELETYSFSSFFRTKKIRTAFINKQYSIKDLLQRIVGDEAYFHQYLFDQQFSHRGWSGMVAVVEEQPHTLLDSRKISLEELIEFELYLELDCLIDAIGDTFKPIAALTTCAPKNILEHQPSGELKEVLELWQDAFEWSYYDKVLAAIQINNTKPKKKSTNKDFQAIFCIDERECSFRRHVEQTNPTCETFGAPGFFGVEFYFQPEGGQFYEKLCPAPVTPTYLIKESNVKDKHRHELLYHKNTHNIFSGYVIAVFLGFWAGIQLLLTIFRPKMSPAISDAFAHMYPHSTLSIENKSKQDIENGLQIGFTVDEMATNVSGFLENIGLIDNFATIIYVIAHGSSSANNPHHGAYNCGACSGRPGAVNARVLAHMANHPKVREQLLDKNIHIPETTQFISAMHDTAADIIAYYDEDILNPTNQHHHQTIKHKIEYALDLNAKERSRRFASINTKASIKKVRDAIYKRSVSMFEPRPELGHGTNTVCVVGRRSVTKGLFLDRRAFMNSYDYTTDLTGEKLVNVMRPIAIVCGGINLEYYFSRVDNYKLGAGTKLPHNVSGLIGVVNSMDGDLRTGLPLQTVEVHDPIRLLIVVEHYPEVVLKTIQDSPAMYEWYINEWVHLVALHPDENEYYQFIEGKFVKYTTISHDISDIDDLLKKIEHAEEMTTNHIVHATQENMPIYVINENLN